MPKSSALAKFTKKDKNCVFWKYDDPEVHKKTQF